MKRNFIVLLMCAFCVFAFLHLAACVSTEKPESNETMTLPSYAFGGCSHECALHAASFHAFDIFVAADILTAAEFREWADPLRALRQSPYDECLVNLSTFIEHFGITREQFQQLIDDTRIDFVLEYNLDVLFSGCRTLIEEYYSIENAPLHGILAAERESAYLSARIQALQRLVNANTQHMSQHFHDIWTYASFMGVGSKWNFHRWMQGLVDAGAYERVNIVEAVDYLGITREIFEHFVDEFNMQIFVHYNTDVIFSGDRQLIASYYSSENEALHDAHVRNALEGY